LHIAGGEAFDGDDIGPLARCDLAAILEAKGLGTREGRGAIGGQGRHAQGDESADHVVEMAFLGDIEGVPIICAQAHVGAGALGQEGGQGVKVFGDGAFADQHAQAFLQFLAGLMGGGGLVFGADTRSGVAVEAKARELGAMAVDMPPGKKLELCYQAGIACENAGVVHHLCQTKTRGMAHQSGEIGGFDTGACGFHVGGGDAGGKLHLEVHQGAFGSGLKPADAIRAKHICNFMGVADGSGDAMGRDATVKLQRCDEGAFDMEVGVDEAGHEDEVCDINHARGLIMGTDANNRIATNGDIAGDEVARHEAEYGAAAQDEIGGLGACALRDALVERGFGHSGAPLGVKTGCHGDAAQGRAGMKMSKKWACFAVNCAEIWRITARCEFSISPDADAGANGAGACLSLRRA